MRGDHINMAARASLWRIRRLPRGSPRSQFLDVDGTL